MKAPMPRSTMARVIAGVLTVGVLAGGGFWVFESLQQGRPAVEVTTVTKGLLVDSVVAVGDIKSGNRHTMTLLPSVKVVEVRVKKGQRVSRGDILAVVDTEEYAEQLKQQGLALEDAEGTLRYVSGPSAAMSQTNADNAVRQAGIVVDGAVSAQAAARRNVSDARDAGGSAVRQAEIALSSARLDADAAESNLDRVCELNNNAVRQAKIAADTAKATRDEAERKIVVLTDPLGVGQITQAEFDAKYPLLRYEFAGAENALRSARVSLDTARVTADATTAAAEKAASDADLAVKAAKATLAAAKDQADAQVRAARQAASDAQRAVAGARIGLSNARSSAKFGRASDDQRAASQENQIERLESNIDYLQGQIDGGNLRAAVDGIVSVVDAVAGNYPQPGDAIVVEGSSGFMASADFGQPDSVGIRPGQSATVTLKDIGVTYNGTVAFVAPTAERSTTAADTTPRVTVEVAILNPDDTLRIGFEADVEVTRDERASVLEVSLDAVRREPGTGRRYVFVVDDDNRVSRAFMTPGIEVGDRVEVLAGVTEGQRCVINPPDSLNDGDTVRVTPGSR